VTFEGHFADLLTVVTLYAQLTRDLLVIAKFLAYLSLAYLKGQICDGCRRRSVFRCPSRVHISKTKQNRLIVTVEYYLLGGNGYVRLFSQQFRLSSVCLSSVMLMHFTQKVDLFRLAEVAKKTSRKYLQPFPFSRLLCIQEGMKNQDF